MLPLEICQTKDRSTYRSGSSNLSNSQTARLTVDETRGGVGCEEDCSDGAEVNGHEGFDGRRARYRGILGFRTGREVKLNRTDLNARCGEFLLGSCNSDGGGDGC